MIKNILLLSIIITTTVIFLVKKTEQKNIENIDVNMEMINDVIEEVETNELQEQIPISEEEILQNYNQSNTQKYISPYYTKYDSIYEKLLEINNDTVGWLKVNNTKINYPVVQTTDNDYYLNHSFDKNVNGAGWVFVDYRDDMNQISKNTIIYAHNVKKNELMFGSLKKVLDDNWSSNSENLTISFDIKGKQYNWTIFSIYTIDKTNDYLVTDFINDDLFVKYIDREKERSIKKFDIDVNIEDKILTLSTCYQDSNHRLVIHAKKM